MVAKAKYIKECHILAEMTTQLIKNDWQPGKNVAIQEIPLFGFILEVYERGTMLVKLVY